MLPAKRDIVHIATVSLIFFGLEAYIDGYADFNPNAEMFSAHQYGQIIISDIGILFWVAGIALSIKQFGFFEVFRTYLVPYLWYVFSSHVIVIGP